MWAVIRMTYGYDEKEAPMSCRYISKMTGIGTGHVSTTIQGLIKKGVLLKRERKGITKSGTPELPKREHHNSPQVIGFNKSIAKILKRHSVTESGTIKKIINLFKESAEAGNFGVALSAWEEKMSEQDKYLKLFLRCLHEINKTYMPGTLTYAYANGLGEEIDRVEQQINHIWVRTKKTDTISDAFVQVVKKYLNLWLSAIAAYKASLENAEHIKTTEGM